MRQRGNSIGLLKDWHSFLKRNDDARIIVRNIMVRIGVTEGGALFYLLAEWEDVNLRVALNATERVLQS